MEPGSILTKQNSELSGHHVLRWCKDASVDTEGHNTMYGGKPALTIAEV